MSIVKKRKEMHQLPSDTQKLRSFVRATNQNITDQSSRIDEIIRLKCGGSTHEVRIIKVEPSVLSKNALHEGQKVNS